MQRVSIFVLLLGCIGSSLCKPEDYTFLIERFEAVPGVVETLVDYSQVSLIRRNRTTIVVFGNMSYHEDLGDETMHMVRTTYSPSGSSNFHHHPFMVQKSTICEFFKDFYRKYGQPWIEKRSNFPHIPEEGLCPLPKGVYYLDDLELSTEDFPKHAPRGLWRIEQVFERKGKSIGGMKILGKIVDK